MTSLVIPATKTDEAASGVAMSRVERPKGAMAQSAGGVDTVKGVAGVGVAGAVRAAAAAAAGWAAAAEGREDQVDWPPGPGRIRACRILLAT